MAANVESMMFQGQIPWHGLGNRINDNDIFDIEKGIKSAGLDWEVDLKGLQTIDNELVKHRACYRKSDGRILGVVGPRWTPIQNWEMFQWFQPWLDAKECELHTAGSLCEGEKVWVLCKVHNNSIASIAKNDDVEKYILLSNSHDGTMAVRVGFTPIRVVCCNTLAMAIQNTASKLIRVRHSSGVIDNLESIRDTMNIVQQTFDASMEQYRLLASKHINSADLRKYVKIVLGVENVKDNELKTRTKNNMDQIFHLISEGLGNKNPAIQGTWWQAYSGINEYLNYYKGRNNNNRMDSLWFGQNATLNNVALETALKNAN